MNKRLSIVAISTAIFVPSFAWAQQCDPAQVISSFSLARSAPGGTATANGRMTLAGSAFNDDVQRDAFVEGSLSIEPATDVTVTTSVAINPSLVEVWAGPLGGFSEAGASLKLEARQGDTILCSSEQELAKNHTVIFGANTSYGESPSATRLSCNMDIDPEGPSTIAARVTLHIWAVNGGVGRALSRADVNVTSIGISRCCVDALEAPEGMVPVFRWWNPDRQDNLLSSHPVWAGCRGSIRSPGYEFVRKEGYIFDPELDPPDDVETVKLYRWWDPDREDNLTTMSQREAGDAEEDLEPNYRFNRLEGYLYRNSQPNTTPMYRWWDPNREDNLTTMSQREAGDAEEDLSPNYKYVIREGYVVNP